MPSVALQARENDAVGGDADEEERSGRGGVDGGAVAVLQEAELDHVRNHYLYQRRAGRAIRAALPGTWGGSGGVGSGPPWDL